MPAYATWPTVLAATESGSAHQPSPEPKTAPAVSPGPFGRVRQPKEGTYPGFSKRYGVSQLVWFEKHPRIGDAIVREKQLKKWRRAWKLELIEAENSGWLD